MESWPCDRPCSTVPDLLHRLTELQTAEGAPRQPGGVPTTYGFRGLARADWALSTTLQHVCNPAHDERGLRLEREVVVRFREDGGRFVGAYERAHLRVAGDTPASWQTASIWGPIAVARHYGVPTRLLDWTASSLIAAYFAACSHPGNDGAVWWFNRSALENQIMGADNGAAFWRGVGVPFEERVPGARLDRSAFTVGAQPWMAMLHSPMPFRRLEVQKGFFTVCGRLDVRHDEALVAQCPTIRRGRLVVPKELKPALLDELERMGIHATTLDYQGADYAAAEIRRQCSGSEWTNSR